MSRRAASLAFFLLCFALLGACGIDTAPDGARRTPPGDGPKVVFDLMRRPLPEIPQPNDIATFADPTSRTGRRINVSLVAPTRLESQARSDFGSLEGWGTFASLTVAFERDPRTPETEAAIDLADVAARTRTWDPSDDPFYVIDLTTGIPVILDTGKRNFPLTVVDPNAYWPNNPRAKADNILYESVEEGAGLGQSAYRPELDTDFDGVLDHPNVITRTGADARVEDVIDWYERESDTLILRPVVPLEEMHEYAVVLTDRLKSASGVPIRSPFEFVHHVAQREEAERVRAILSDGSKAKQAYYGDVAGTGLDHVAFMWSFTTQPVFDDMRLLRNGLHGRGPFARLAHDFPPTARAFRAAGLALQESDEAPGGVDADPRCATVNKTPYIVRLADSQKTLFELLDRLSSVLGVRGEELRTLKDSLDSIDHIVIGSFESPYFLGDPEHEDPDGRFELNFKTGEGRVARDTVQFWLTVPKPTAAAHAPFPVTTWSHGSSNNDAEVLIRAGYFAKQGLAMMAINMPGHGLVIDEGLQTFAGSLLRGVCLTPFVTALAAGRARDLNGDGVADPGGLLWTAHVFHSRDNIRQSVIDQLQATRVLRSWDGALRSDQDYNGDGVADLAGDFDGDGVVDVGGPNVPITTSGNSYGGVVAMIHGAVDPNVAASAPISGGGGLIDLTARSKLVPDLVIEQSMTPLIVAVPSSSVGKRNDVPQTRCSGDQRSLRFVVNDLTSSREIEIACLSPAELDAGKTVVLENLRNHERRCARTTEEGRLRIPIPANVDDRLDLQIYDAPDVVASYKSCEVEAGAPIGRRVSTFEQPFVEAGVVGDGSHTCEAAVAASGVEQDKGCAQFRDRFFPVGSPLVAPQEGLGLLRQSPELRRLFMLSQMGVEGGNPINFAPYFALRPAPGVDGEPMPPRPIVHFGTAGDPFVPSASGYAFARALGALPFLPTGFVYTHPEWAAYATPRDLQTALGDKTPNDVLIESWTLEGVARMERSSGGPACKPNYAESDVCTSPPSTRACKRAVFDPDWLSEGANLWDAPHPAVPLRLARSAEVAIVDADSLTRAWEPRLHGAPLSPDNAGYRAPTPLLGQINAWIQPGGTHVFINPDPCKAFDDVLYYDGLLVRFLASAGRDLAFLSHPGSHRCLEKGDCPFL